MRKVLLSALIICFGALIPAACSSSQFTLYKPSDDEPAWRVSVEQKVEFPSPRFFCVVNDSTVIEGLFELFTNSFEKDGIYRERPVKMSGFRTSHTTLRSTGSTMEVESGSVTYQVRVFINEEEVGIFDF